MRANFDMLYQVGFSCVSASCLRDSAAIAALQRVLPLGVRVSGTVEVRTLALFDCCVYDTVSRVAGSVFLVLLCWFTRCGLSAYRVQADGVLPSSHPRRCRCPTGLHMLDRALRGGLLCGHVTEVAGPACVGKTQMCMQLVAQSLCSRFRESGTVVNIHEVCLSLGPRWHAKVGHAFSCD